MKNTIVHSIQNQVISLEEKTYSENVLGYFISISGKPHYIINDLFNITKKGEIYLKLRRLSREFENQDVFILLYNDFQVHIATGGVCHNSIIERDVI